MIASLRDIFLGLCPRCRKGRIFKSGLAGAVGVMNDICPACGLRFMREAGYFLGAMYVSYGLGVATVLPVAIVLAVVVKLDLVLILTIVLLQTLISVPVLLRFSRVIWLYLDQAIDPR